MSDGLCPISPDAEYDGTIYMLVDKDVKLRDCLVKEDELDGRPVIAIEILPRMEEFGDDWNAVEAYFHHLVGEINATLPTTHQVSKITVRHEDFKRTGAMKVSRN